MSNAYYVVMPEVSIHETRHEAVGRAAIMERRWRDSYKPHVVGVEPGSGKDKAVRALAKHEAALEETREALRTDGD